MYALRFSTNFLYFSDVFEQNIFSKMAVVRRIS
jgi:hypothetical protein